MLKKIKTHLGTIAALTTMLTGNIAVARTITAPPGMQTDLGNLINSILTYVLGIAGVIVVIYLIMGGFKYITSGGSEKAVGEAKNTILYAIIGLIIIIAAFAIKSYIMTRIAPGAIERF